MHVPLETRCEVFRKTNIFIPEGNCCCRTHMIGKSFFEDDLAHLRLVSQTSKISAKDVVSLFRTFSTIANISLLIALIICLFKLGTGNSNKVIASVLGLPYEQQVSTFSNEILKSFEKDILPFFGLTSIPREDLISSTTSTARRLLALTEGQLVLIFDGTYIRYQKSQNNEYQKKSYSGQMKTHLCKPFTICTRNWFIVDFAEPFYGTQNNATIMKQVLEDSGLKSLLRRMTYFL